MISIFLQPLKQKLTIAPMQEARKQPTTKLAALSRVIRRLSAQAIPRLEEQFGFVLEQLCEAAQAPWGCVHLADDEHRVLVMVAKLGMPGPWGRLWSRIPIDSYLPPALAYKRAEVVALAGEAAPQGLEAVECAPVLGARVAIGTLGVLWPEGEPPADDPERAELLIAMGELVGMAIEQAGLVAELSRRLEEVSRLNRRLEELSITDGLTGLYNRRYL